MRALQADVAVEHLGGGVKKLVVQAATGEGFYVELSGQTANVLAAALASTEQPAAAAPAAAPPEKPAEPAQAEAAISQPAESEAVAAAGAAEAGPT